MLDSAETIWEGRAFQGFITLQDLKIMLDSAKTVVISGKGGHSKVLLLSRKRMIFGN